MEKIKGLEDVSKEIGEPIGKTKNLVLKMDIIR